MAGAHRTQIEIARRYSQMADGNALPSYMPSNEQNL